MDERMTALVERQQAFEKRRKPIISEEQFKGGKNFFLLKGSDGRQVEQEIGVMVELVVS